jgi:hypothetical protein
MYVDWFMGHLPGSLYDLLLSICIRKLFSLPLKVFSDAAQHVYVDTDLH